MSYELEDKILDILNDRMVQDPGKCCEEIHQAYIEAGYAKDRTEEIKQLWSSTPKFTIEVCLGGSKEAMHEKSIECMEWIANFQLDYKDEFAPFEGLDLITDDETNVTNYSGLVRPEFKIYDSSIRLSGEEWYTRFQTALHENNNSTSIQGGWMTVNLADEAAAKASGMK